MQWDFLRTRVSAVKLALTMGTQYTSAMRFQENSPRDHKRTTAGLLHELWLPRELGRHLCYGSDLGFDLGEVLDDDDVDGEQKHLLPLGCA